MKLGLLVGGAALLGGAAYLATRPPQVLVPPGGKAPPAPVPPPPPSPPTLPPVQAQGQLLSVPGWAWVPPGQVPTGRVRAAMTVTGLPPGGPPLFVDVMADVWNMVLYAPYAPDPADWPTAVEAQLLAQNPYYAQSNPNWRVVHWEGDFKGAHTPYLPRASPAQGAFLLTFGAWVRTEVA